MLTKSKTFHQLLLEHSTNPKKVKRYLEKDKRLTRDEKTILHCFFLFRENQHREGLEVIENVKIQTDPLVESMRCFLLGSMLNNLGLQAKAIPHFVASLKAIPKGVDLHLEFVILLNLFTISINQKTKQLASDYLGQMNQLQGLDENDALTLLKCNFNFATISMELNKAKLLYQALEKKKDQFRPHTLMVYYLDVWDYAIANQDFSLCEEILSLIKEQRVYTLTQNYNYMKLLLAHYTEDKSVFISETVFRDFPKLHHELKVIRALETNKVEEARGYWNYLMTLNSQAFRPNFEYQGHATIFSLCLKKHEAKFKTKSLEIKADQNKSLTDNLKTILLKNEELTKDELFMALFGREAESKEDYSRLSREIYKCKTQFCLEIDTKKGKVSLIKKAA